MMKTVVIQAQQKWECHAVIRHSEGTLADAVTEFGQAGWEPFAVFHYRDAKGTPAWVAFMKRPSAGGPGKSGDQTAARDGHSAGPGSAGDPTITPPGADVDGEMYDVKKE